MDICFIHPRDPSQRHIAENLYHLCHFKMKRVWLNTKKTFDKKKLVNVGGGRMQEMNVTGGMQGLGRAEFFKKKHLFSLKEL